jgi:hypothetical protein
MVQIVDEVFLVRDTFHERGPIVLDATGLFTPRPAVAVAKMKVAREDLLRDRDVAPYGGLFDLRSRAASAGVPVAFVAVISGPAP